MRRLQISRLIIGTGLVWLAVGVAGGWLLATAMQQPAAGTPLFWGVLALLFAGVGGAVILLRRLVRAFLLDVHNLAEAGQIALTANSNYRVDPGGHPDVAALAQVLNAFMERYAALRREQSAAVQRARADLEEERNLLAALMAELTDGVLVCNQDGQILLYNRAARTLLDSAGNGAGGFVGLGRSIFGVIDRSAIAHAVDQVGYRHRRADHDGSERAVMASFVTATAGGRIVRARLAPFASQDGAPRGYVVTLQDMSEGIERSTRRDALLQVLTERVRAALGAIRAASETIETFPQMAEERRTRLQKVVHDEAQSRSDQLNQTLRIYAADLRAHWRLEEMPGRDLLWAACCHLQDKLGATVHVEEAAEELWLKIDSYALVQGLTYTARRLKEDFGVSTLTLVLDTAERFATLDLRWVTPPVDAATWQHWKEELLTADDSDAVTTLREVADRHGGEVWFQHTGGAGSAYFRLLLPRSVSAGRPAAIAELAPPAMLESRPEYYDFDLFRRPVSRPDLEDRNLRELTYTVFDTETTGLTPGLDEIVAIGALRIVNGRLLRQEVFEQLVSPGRPIPSAASAIHGITDEMVRDQPPIEVVLPRFQHFVEDTVLVGHNVAFDLRMLQEKEANTGVCLVAPVLDTLLLSAVLHPEASSHSLEALALRFGVVAIGRHTALGDAMMTGEVFLRMLPLLEAKGISTLREAHEAARQTYFARIDY